MSPCCSFSRDRPRFNDTLDVIKFLCKDLWMLVFRKQIDNLKTNHRVRWVASSWARHTVLSCWRRKAAADFEVSREFTF